MTCDIGRIALRLREAGLPPALDVPQSRLLIEVLRRVSLGQPVRAEQTEDVISALGVPSQEGVSFLSALSERDADGNIVGIFGLSQKDHPHRFEINGRKLSGWCAWDTLFLPALLNETAHVRSVCPSTNKEILLTVTPATVEQCQPATAVLSIVLLDSSDGAVRPAEEIRRLFCCRVQFFSSLEDASEWFKKSSYDPIVLSVREGHQLGLDAFRDLIGHARDFS